jgi:hypothetical protein
METSQKSTQKNYQTSTYLSGDSLASLSALLEKEEELTMPEVLYSLKSQGLPKPKNLAFYSWKMLKDYSQAATEEQAYFMTEAPKLIAQNKHKEVAKLKLECEARLSSKFKIHWYNWTIWGKSGCLTAKITESHKIEKGCSLSDILEENPDPKYFLSEKMVEFLTRNCKNQFNGRYKPTDKGGWSPTLTARYWKQGKTDPYIQDNSKI